MWWENTFKAAGLYSADEQTGCNQYRIHSFRKFFITQLIMAGQKTLAEHLAGHEGYLDGSYRCIGEEEACKAYHSVQHVLTISIPPEFREKAWSSVVPVHRELLSTGWLSRIPLWQGKKNYRIKKIPPRPGN